MSQALQRARPGLPALLLGLILALSLGARTAWLAAPCRTPCAGATAHLLVFDESYYVNAARVIAGVRPPAGVPYAGAPLGVDPNAEHPQLVKLLMAGAIDLFGDGPLAWRIVSLLAGTLALLGLYRLARAAGAGQRLALTATAVMALDSLLVIEGRIGTLDVAALAGMLWGVAEYLRGRPLAAGILLAVAAAAKEVGMLGLAVVALLELAPSGLRQGRRKLVLCALAAGLGFVDLLWVMGRLAEPYDDAHHLLLGGSPFVHLWHVITYGAAQRIVGGPHGIESYPWQWLIDQRPIVMLNIDPGHPAAGLVGIHPPVHFVGVISPPILLLGLPVLLWWTILPAVRRLRGRRATPPARDRNGVRTLALAWFLAAYTPFLLAALLFQRTSYLYYMTSVMPALYLAAAVPLASARSRRALAASGVWMAALATAAILLYPFTPLP